MLMKKTPVQVHGTHYTRWVKVDLYLCSKEQTQAIFKANKLALASLMLPLLLFTDKKKLAIPQATIYK